MANSTKPLALVAVLALSGCSALTSAGSALLGRGVNANVQAGAENRQAVISQENAAPSVSVRPRANVGDIRQEQNQVRAESIGTVNQGLLWWQWVILGMLIPGPLEWFLAWRLSRKT